MRKQGHFLSNPAVFSRKQKRIFGRQKQKGDIVTEKARDFGYDKGITRDKEAVQSLPTNNGGPNMGLFDFLKAPDVNQGIEDCKSAPGAVLLDVRTPQEYNEGHIPGSVNIPLSTLGGTESVPYGKDVPLYVYCHSGARSSQAVRILAQMGYTRVRNIGGISGYKGKVE